MLRMINQASQNENRRLCLWKTYGTLMNEYINPMIVYAFIYAHVEGGWNKQNFENFYKRHLNI